MNRNRDLKKEPVKVRISSSLLADAKRLSPARIGRSTSRMVEEGLRLWVIARKRAHFSKGFRRMARDPQARAINLQINREFSVTDADGLEGP